MEQKQIYNWATQPDVCRCCLSASGSFDMSVAYVSDTGKKELYQEILQECLGISLSHLGGCSPSRMVCTLCISQLRLASAFKSQVLQSERHFNIYHKAQIVTEDQTIKQEEEDKEKKFEKLEVNKKLSANGDVNKKSDDSNPSTIPMPRSNRGPIKKPDQSATVRDRREILKRTQKKETKELCKNAEYDSDTPIAKLADISCLVNLNNETLEVLNGGGEPILKDNVIKSIKDEAPYRCRPIKPVKQISERKRIKITCSTVLQYTTACPFRHFKSWFRCFFCTEDFMEIPSLRDHMLNSHTDVGSELQTIKRYPRSLQLDITDLECRRCGLKMADVSTMKKHLEGHKEAIYTECIADYKLDSVPYSCHICGDRFHVFRTLTTHLNVHYANCICDVCGRPFLNSKRLKVHKRLHDRGSYPCSICGKILPTQTSRSNHVESAHSRRVLRCHLCHEPMKHYNARVKHMSEAHHITHSFRCKICGRDYNVKHYLATHMRQSHGAKDKKCEECGMTFITSHCLKKHMRKHTGEKPFVCTVCRKAYARGYTLKEHMRTHDRDPVRSE